MSSVGREEEEGEGELEGLVLKEDIVLGAGSLADLVGKRSRELRF